MKIHNCWVLSGLYTHFVLLVQLEPCEHLQRLKGFVLVPGILGMDATSGQSEVCKNIEDGNLLSSSRLHSCLRFSKIIPKYCWLWWYLVGEELNQILFNVENLLSVLLKSLTGPHLLLCLQVLEVGEECEHLGGGGEQPEKVKIKMVWAEDITVNRQA